MSPAKDTNNAQLKRERDSSPTTLARPVCIECTADCNHDDAIILKRNRKRPRPSLEVPSPAIVPDGPTIPSLNSLHNPSSSSSCPPPPPPLECRNTPPNEPVKPCSSLEISNYYAPKPISEFQVSSLYRILTEFRHG